MNVIVQDAVEQIVHIPYNFNKGDKSELTLLKESGYFKLYEYIQEKELVEVLKLYPHVISEWLQLSNDNRSSPRWSFRQGEEGRYFVGHWPDSKEFEEINTTDKFYACAAFIKRDIERTRLLFRSAKNSPDIYTE